MRSGFTSGEFTFEENVKTGDYQSRKASAKISFNVMEGDSFTDWADQARIEATRQVHVALGIKSDIKVPAKVVEPVKTEAKVLEAVGAPAMETQVINEAPTEEKKPRGRPKKNADVAQLDLVEAVEATQTAELPVTDTKPTEQSFKEVSQKELGEAAADTATRIGDKNRVKKLIASFCPGAAMPGVAYVAVERRQELMDAFTALK